MPGPPRSFVQPKVVRGYFNCTMISRDVWCLSGFVGIWSSKVKPPSLQLVLCAIAWVSQSGIPFLLLQEPAKKMEERAEQLAGEVASLRETLEKLVTQMAAK